tara:strand:+ start:307 stop:645 length:339 start_codon:yes stop_codon:yes gene_type:complete
MELIEFIKIKRNANKYIDMLETELINQTVQAPTDPGPIEFGIPIDSYIHRSRKYTRKDLEMECNQYFEKNNLDFEMKNLDPIEYDYQMQKANNRLKFRKQQRKKLKLSHPLD